MGAEMLAELADLLLPRRCVGCGRPRTALCSACVPAQDSRLSVAGLPVYAAAGYRGAARAAVIAYKERERADLRGPLAALLARSLRNLFAGDGIVETGAGNGCEVARLPVVIVPVPSSRAAVHRRGDDVIRRLARAAARRLGGGPAVRVQPALRLTRPVLDSTGLTVAERAENLAGAMVAPAPVSAAGARRAVVVDDVCTTGATITEAARALGAAGWTVSGAAVVAVTAPGGRHRSAAPGSGG